MTILLILCDYCGKEFEYTDIQTGIIRSDGNDKDICQECQDKQDQSEAKQVIEDIFNSLSGKND